METYQIKKVNNVKWISDHLLVRYLSGFAIVNEQDQIVSRYGSPEVYRLKSAAKKQLDFYRLMDHCK